VKWVGHFLVTAPDVIIKRRFIFKKSLKSNHFNDRLIPTLSDRFHSLQCIRSFTTLSAARKNKNFVGFELEIKLKFEAVTGSRHFILKKVILIKRNVVLKF